jgi:PadR family transcriptional regulator PadR
MSNIGPKERLLEYLTKRPTERFHGYQLIKDTSVQSGTLYPQLARWEREGLIATEWEERPGKRPRKYYRLTGAGAEAARYELAALRAARQAAAQRGTAGFPRPATGGAH